MTDLGVGGLSLLELDLETDNRVRAEEKEVRLREAAPAGVFEFDPARGRDFITKGELKFPPHSLLKS